MLVCTAALLALRPGTHSLSVVAVGMLTGFAYNASWLPGQLAPKKAFTGAKVAYVALTWSLGCVALPYTVKVHRAAATAAAAAAAAAAAGSDIELRSQTDLFAAGNAGRGVGGMFEAAPLSMLLMYLGVAAFTAATVHNADVPDITADRAAGVKTIAAAVGRSNSLLVSAALAAAGTLAGLATGAVWLAGVGPFALLATSVIAAGWDEAGVMLDDSQGMLAGMLAALLV
ncbi:hypothetical protein OEZ85_004297 [Tetradesmus obliquus]|uniref:Uncharacterized protein n=1 Tax=Tetradesmus obliquus TaxID=3088 RepID=A0ABY8UKY9_TETOB|nr:hypothetical protein OEZ85_004297 [Tetradesmus obliquus]